MIRANYKPVSDSLKLKTFNMLTPKKRCVLKDQPSTNICACISLYVYKKQKKNRFT